MEVRLLFLETSFCKGTFLKADKQLVHHHVQARGLMHQGPNH
jgi:hypothetical protein